MRSEADEKEVLLYAGRRKGVAIAVAESQGLYSAVDRNSDRIKAVRVDTKEGYWTILSVCAPQTDCPESEKGELYLRLDDVIRSTTDGDYRTIAGDLNGHVGSDRRGLGRGRMTHQLLMQKSCYNGMLNLSPPAKPDYPTYM
ncbi:hypothetical protein TELCIR_10661 [Teladorsagia circumcincta]|uniref:Endonuclease/exonuclease/phosphatase domain-containing protein n=1 Tax=Teladorsagia circumcincta TaxID=45464 RepID=A0A2G9UBI5_TELCI|nr:hypothetical protein TELCIR_10661 [Teladorsagia circumcincta]